MFKLDFKKKLILVSLFGFLGIVILTISSYLFSSWLIKNLDDVISQRLPVTRYLAQIDMVHDQTRGLFAEIYIAKLKNDEASLNAIKNELNEAKLNVKNYYSIIESKDISEELKTKILKDEKDFEKYQLLAEDFLNNKESLAPELLQLKLDEFHGKFEILAKQLEETSDFSENESKVKFDFIEQNSKFIQIATLICGLVLILVSLISLFIVLRSVGRLPNLSTEIGDSSNNVGANVGQVITVAGDLVQASEEQSQNLLKTTSAIEEISAMLERSSDRAAHVEEQARESQKLSERGKRTVEELISSIHKLRDSSDKSAKELSESNQKINSISDVVKQVIDKTKIINDIVFQTKLLSFNASVEAARAGEHGQGFSVVAQEIGNLAQMSGQAAKEINSILDSCMTNVNEIVHENKIRVENMIDETKQLLSSGVSAASQCQQALTEIYDASTKVSQMVTEITTSAEESSKGVVEVKQAITLIDNNAQFVAKSAENMFKSTRVLTSEVDNLRHIASSLNIFVRNKPLVSNFNWRDDYLLHVPDMDNEHKILVSKINDLAHELREGSHRSIIQAYEAMAQYVVEHFSHEENYMRSIGYPALEQHKKIHANLLEQAGEFKARVESGNFNTEELVTFLNDWLLKHILGVDMKYARYSKGQRTKSVYLT